MSKRARRSDLLLVLLAITVGSSAVRAQNRDPDIRLASPCPAQPPSVPLTFSAKPGDTVGSPTLPAEIGVKDSTGKNPFTQNVIWSLAAQTGCSGSELALTCAQNVYNVAAPTGTVSPTTSAGRVQITTGLLAAGDVGKQGPFAATVTKAPAGFGDPQCTWNYLLRVTNSGGGWGDPHMTTVDGVHYDFQAAGEFTALREDKLEVQTRQRPVPTTTVPGANDYTGLGVCVAIYSAVAVKIGSNRVTLQPNLSGQPDPSGLQLRVNGTLVTLPDGGLDLRAVGGDPNGPLEGRIVRAAGGAYEFDDARGTQLVATPTYWESQQTWYLNLNVYQTSATRGIWGRLAEGSWLPALPDGSSLGAKPEALDQRYQDLYEKFGNAWRVTDATSLFYYAPGTNTATFTVADWPRFNTRSCLIQGQTSAEPTTPQIAAQACSGITDPAQKADCTFDVTVTGNTGFAQTYGTMQGFQPHGSGWQPGLVAVQGVPPTTWPWWWWILILILVLIIMAVLIMRRKKTV
jgi:hypothetical protein